MKAITPEQVKTAYDALPRPVRSYLLSTKPYDFVSGLQQKYGLHVDVVGVLSQFVIYLLCGVISPWQFQKALTELGIPDEQANQLIQDLNEKVFKPLQEEIKNAPPEEKPEQSGVAVPFVPPVPQAPAPSMPVRPPIPAPQPRPIPPPPRIEMQQTPPVPVTPPLIQPAAPMPPPAPVIPPAPQQPARPAPAPQAPTPPQRPPMAPSIPRPVSTPVSSPNPVPRPVNPQQNTPRPASSNREELHNILKQYGVDPYREPPE